MSGIVSLEPLDGGDLIQVPNEKTVIGRGTFLQVSDKRVSRSHATIEINNGKLIIVPTHTNPCFYKHKGSGPQLVLAKDKPKTLEDGDVLSLLPDKLFFKIIYENKKKNNLEESDEENGHDEEIEEESPKNKKIKPVAKRNGDNATPTKKTKTPVQKEKPVAKAAPAGRGRPAKRFHSEEEIEFVGEDEADDVDYQEDEDDDDEYGKKKKPKPKKRPHSLSAKKTNGRTTRRRSRNDDDDDGLQRKRRPRAVTQKRPRYTDDDFVMSDEEFEIEEVADVDGEEKQDSDFVAEEDDSGSDWGSKKKNNSQKSIGKRKSGGSRNRGRGRRKASDSEEMSEESVEDYVPRSTKRRGFASKKQDSEVEASDEEYNNKSKTSSNKRQGRKVKKSDDEEMAPVVATPKGRRGRKPKLVQPVIADDEEHEENNKDEEMKSESKSQMKEDDNNMQTEAPQDQNQSNAEEKSSIELDGLGTVNKDEVQVDGYKDTPIVELSNQLLTKMEESIEQTPITEDPRPQDTSDLQKPDTNETNGEEIKINNDAEEDSTKNPYISEDAIEVNSEHQSPLPHQLLSSTNINESSIDEPVSLQDELPSENVKEDKDVAETPKDEIALDDAVDADAQELLVNTNEGASTAIVDGDDKNIDEVTLDDECVDEPVIEMEEDESTSNLSENVPSSQPLSNSNQEGETTAA